MKPNQLTTDSAEYKEHLDGEVSHYSQIFSTDTASGRQSRQSLTQAVPESWTELERRARQLIIDRTGKDLSGHVLHTLNASPEARMLSLGSGPGGVEIGFAAAAPGAKIDCLDVNQELLDLGRQRAAELSLPVTFASADLNKVDLPPGTYDVVFCHAALHHLIELKRIARQIRRTLKPGGQLITVDICSRTGYLMWPESRKIVASIFAALPKRLRLNHTAYGELRVDDAIWEMDTSVASMECIHSEEILPVLQREFSTIHFVPYFSICRRLLDTMYGPNYKLSEKLDRAVFDAIWELDVHYLAAGTLRPETFFAVYSA